LCLFLSGCSKQREWGVLSVVPDSVSTKNAKQTAVYYVLIQTHEPIFRQSDGQNYTSQILKQWHRSVDYTEYSFCPDTTLKFNNKARLTLRSFYEHVVSITRKYTPEVLIGENGSCVVVKFKSSRKGYLGYLTSYSNAPTIDTGGGIEDGLGQFSVKSLTADKLVLERKTPISNGYNKVVIYEYKGKTDPRLQSRDIADFNMVNSGDIPEWVKKEYVPFVNVELTVGSLVLNIPDRELRLRVYNCLNVAELRKAFFPGPTEFGDIGNVLPLGVPGARAGKPRQVCDGKRMRRSETGEILFANWRRDNYAEMAEFAKKIRKETGIPLTVVNWEPAKLVARLHKPNRPYSLVPIIMNTMRPELSDFLFYTIKDIGYLDFEPREIAANYKRLLLEDNPEKKEALAKEIIKEFEEEGLVLPLYQNKKVLWYPREIINLNVGKGFLEFPVVSELRC